MGVAGAGRIPIADSIALSAAQVRLKTRNEYTGSNLDIFESHIRVYYVVRDVSTTTDGWKEGHAPVISSRPLPLPSTLPRPVPPLSGPDFVQN